MASRFVEFLNTTFFRPADIDWRVEDETDTISVNVCYSIRPSMQAILVDWLVDVHSHFKMLQETLNICVSVIDSFLQVILHSLFSKLCLLCIGKPWTQRVAEPYLQCLHVEKVLKRKKLGTQSSSSKVFLYICSLFGRLPLWWFFKGGSKKGIGLQEYITFFIRDVITIYNWERWNGLSLFPHQIKFRGWEYSLNKKCNKYEEIGQRLDTTFSHYSDETDFVHADIGYKGPRKGATRSEPQDRGTSAGPFRHLHTFRPAVAARAAAQGEHV